MLTGATFPAGAPFSSPSAFWQRILPAEVRDRLARAPARRRDVLGGWLLLIAQATLIRTQRREWHRALGKVSYVLVPLIVVSTLLLAHYRMKQEINQDLLYFFYVQVALVGVLALFMGDGDPQPAIADAAHALHGLRARSPSSTRSWRACSTSSGIDYPPTQVLTYALVDAILLVLIRSDVRRAADDRRCIPACSRSSSRRSCRRSSCTRRPAGAPSSSGTPRFPCPDALGAGALGALEDRLDLRGIHGLHEVVVEARLARAARGRSPGPSR